MYKMKHSRLSFFALLLAAVGLFSGCAKELNQVPQSTASNAAVFGSTDGLQLYANSFYNNLPGISDVYKTDASMSDLGTQSGVPTYISQGAYTSRQTAAAIGWVWTPLRNLNYFIANVRPSANVSQTQANNYLGLARFFRAYFYYGMVQKFGDVPWIGKPLGVNDSALYAKRDPRTLVMDSVMADLNFACNNITLTGDATASQITKWVAYGLKSRICLYEGTFRRYQTSYGLQGSAPQWLQAAASAAKAVMDSAGFKLNVAGGTASSYRALFISPAPVNTEVMWAVVSSSALAIFNDANWWYTSGTYGPRFSFIRSFINTYLNIDGTPFTDIPGHDTLPFVKETKGRDMRLQQTIRMGSYTRTSGGVTVAAPPVFNYTYTGYMPIKWTLDDAGYDNAVDNINSICLMRYAEILLNYAEAQEELGQLKPADWTNTIGALRARAGITGNLGLPTVVDPYMQSTYFPDITDPVLMEIRRERGIELCLEGFRVTDLFRWKHGELLNIPWNGMYVPGLNQLIDMNGDGVPDVCFYQGTPPTPAVPTVTYVNVAPSLSGPPNPQILAHGTYGEIHWLDNVPRDFETYKYVYPIPYTEILLNPNLTQNPTWQ
jgi:hypothetical protein